MLQKITEGFQKKHEKPGIKKRGLGPDQFHYNQSRLSARLHTTLVQITRITPSEYTLNTLY